MFMRAGYNEHFRVVCKARIGAKGIRGAVLVCWQDWDTAWVIPSLGTVRWAENVPLQLVVFDFIRVETGPRPQSQYPRRVQ